MAAKIYLTGGAINIDDGVNDLVVINPRQFDWKISNLTYSVRDKIDNQSYTLGALADIQNEGGTGFATSDLLITYLNGLMKGTADVAIQDQHTPTVIVDFNKETDSTTLSALGVLNEFTVTVTASTGISAGSYFIIFNPTSIRYSTFYVVSILGLVVTLDSPLDFAYPIGSFVSISITNMAVDGSATPQVFGIRGVESPNSVSVDIDITRIIFECITTNPVDLSLFGDLGALSRGLLLRSRNGVVNNVLNVKTNGEIARKMFDWTPYAATNPQQGINGFISRLTFAGQSKLGVTKRLMPDEDLEFWIQDALQTLISLKATVEGHVVLI